MVTSVIRKSGLKGFLLFIGLTILIAGQAGCAAKKEAFSIKLAAAVNKESASIGDEIEYTLTIYAPEDMELQFPDFDEGLGGLTVKDLDSREKSLFGKRTITRRYTLLTYKPGEYAIPEIAVNYRKIGAKEWKTAKAAGLKISVKSMLKEEPGAKDIRDIKGPLSFSGGRRGILFMIFILLIIIIFAVWSLFKRRKAGALAAPPKPAHEIAYEALRALREKHLAEHGMIKEIYIELSDIVRHYLENRFILRAPEMTTEEFLDKLKDTDMLSYDQKILLKDFLFHCDLVKFARYGPTEKEIDSSFKSAENLVDQTKRTAEGEDKR